MKKSSQARPLHNVPAMSVVLSYYSADQSWSRRHEMTCEQAALNAGARRIYAARLQHMPPPEAPRPHPGHSALPAAFPKAIPASDPPPASFEVIVLTPQVVEHLDLNPHPHRRRRWSREAGWAAEELNP